MVAFICSSKHSPSCLLWVTTLTPVNLVSPSSPSSSEDALVAPFTSYTGTPNTRNSAGNTLPHRSHRNTAWIYAYTPHRFSLFPSSGSAGPHTRASPFGHLCYPVLQWVFPSSGFSWVCSTTSWTHISLWLHPHLLLIRSFGRYSELDSRCSPTRCTTR